MVYPSGTSLISSDDVFSVMVKRKGKSNTSEIRTFILNNLGVLIIVPFCVLVESELIHENTTLFIVKLRPAAKRKEEGDK